MNPRLPERGSTQWRTKSTSRLSSVVLARPLASKNSISFSRNAKSWGSSLTDNAESASFRIDSSRETCSAYSMAKYMPEEPRLQIFQRFSLLTISMASAWGNSGLMPWDELLWSEIERLTR